MNRTDRLLGILLELQARGARRAVPRAAGRFAVTLDRLVGLAGRGLVRPVR